MPHVDPVIAIVKYVERAESLARSTDSRLMRLPPIQRRRLLAEAVFAELRQDRQSPEIQPHPAPRR